MKHRHLEQPHARREARMPVRSIGGGRPARKRRIDPDARQAHPFGVVRTQTRPAVHQPDAGGCGIPPLPPKRQHRIAGIRLPVAAGARQLQFGGDARQDAV
jgi:hypothetical protein